MAKKEHQPKTKYWDIRPIKKIPALYRIVFGERSNGKTYGVDLDCLSRYLETGGQTAYVRRWQDDIRARKMQQKFEALAVNGEIGRLSGGKWNGIQYRNGSFTLYACTVDENDKEIIVYDTQPFAYIFALSNMEHDKSIPFPRVTRIVFDEFISRMSYIPDEFSIFMNLISSIVRDRDNVEIWMLGNTVSKDCPYFREMGLKHISQQKPGTIDTYTYNKNGQEMIVAVEYTANLAAKKSDKYFIFDNPKLDMITGGAWELAIYPHLFEKYKPNQIMFVFFVDYRETLLQLECVDGDNGVFIYCHLKTTPLQNRDDDLVYCTEPTNKTNYRQNIMRPLLPVENKIGQLIQTGRICYQDNEIGEVFNDYLKWCRSSQVIKR